MVLSFRKTPEAPIEAYVFAESFTDAEALARDLDKEFGAGGWRAVGDAEAPRLLANLGAPTAFAIFAVSGDEAQTVEATAALIRQAREQGMPILLIVGELSSRAIHRLIREGVAEFTPCPDADGALPQAINRMRLLRAGAGASSLGFGAAAQIRRSRVITAYGAAGGVGASTFVVNLAWEIAITVRKEGRRVALLDFNFQYGSIATYLDVPRREAVYELVSEAALLDQTGLTPALSVCRDKLHVLTAPRDALPLDRLLGEAADRDAAPEDIELVPRRDGHAAGVHRGRALAGPGHRPRRDGDGGRPARRWPRSCRSSRTSSAPARSAPRCCETFPTAAP